MLSRGLFFLFVLLWAAGAQCEVHEKLTESQYEVHGDDHSSLLSLLNEATPIRSEGKKFHAFTSWHVHWSFRWHIEPDGQCGATSVNVELSSKMQLPKLIGGSAQQRQAFYPYLSALRTHEFGHYQIGKDAADAIDRGIQHLPFAASCLALDREVSVLGYRLLDEYRMRERQYDRSTGYGKTQGASLMP